MQANGGGGEAGGAMDGAAITKDAEAVGLHAHTFRVVLQRNISRGATIVRSPQSTYLQLTSSSSARAHDADAWS